VNEARRWAVENARGLGHHLTSWLLARGEQVVDVPPSATARVRQLSRGAGRKNDRIEAAAAACGAARHRAPRPVQPENSTDALALLDERRSNLAQARVRAVNQLHALLRALLPGGAPRDLSAAKAEQLLESVVPAGPAELTRHALAADLVAEIRTWDVKLKDNAKVMAALVASQRRSQAPPPAPAARSAWPHQQSGACRDGPTPCGTETDQSRRSTSQRLRIKLSDGMMPACPSPLSLAR
jgi:transposase